MYTLTLHSFYDIGQQETYLLYIDPYPCSKCIPNSHPNTELSLLHWAAGTVTARSIYAEVKAFEQRSGIANENTYWLIFELLWRDYMKFYALKYGRDMFMLGGVQGEVGRYSAHLLTHMLSYKYLHTRTSTPTLETSIHGLQILIY